MSVTVRFGLTDGQVRSFVQADAAIAAEYLRSGNLTNVFRKGLLGIGSAERLVMIAGERVAWIEWHTALALPDAFGQSIARGTAIESRAEFDRMRDAPRAAAAAEQVFIRFRFVGGLEYFAAFEAKQAGNISDRLQRLNVAIGAAFIAAQLPGGGVVLINPQRIGQMDIYRPSGGGDLPGHIWPLTPQGDE